VQGSGRVWGITHHMVGRTEENRDITLIIAGLGAEI
jgi:hypothetical protein